MNKDACGGHQEPIVAEEFISAAIKDARHFKTQSREMLDLLDIEPELRDFLEGKLLEMAGRLALDGAPPSIVRKIHGQSSFMLAVTFVAVCQAYRRLYEELLPQSECQSP